jgi:predicted hotdog family 3-hydroxylacyl-ACP dehydratase
MRVVERVLAADDSSVETVSTVRETWPTVEHGHARTLMLIELVAQSAAALVGWVERDNDSPNRHGYLVGVPCAEIRRPLVAVGTVLHCHVKVTQAIENYRGFEARVVDEDGNEFATATIQAIRPDEES